MDSIQQQNSAWMNNKAGYGQQIRSAIWANRKLVGADMVVVFLSVVVGLVLAAGPHFGWTEIAALPAFIGLALLIALPTFIIAGFYRRHASSSTLRDAMTLLPGEIVAVLGLAAVTRGTDWIHAVPLNTFPIIFLTQMPLHGGLRLIARSREALRRSLQADQGQERTPVVLVGLGATSDLFLRSVHQGLSRYEVMGIIDSSVGSTDLLFHSVPILGSVRDPQAIIDRLSAAPRLPRCMFLTETTTQFDQEGMERILHWAEGHGVRVCTLPNLNEPLHEGAQACEAPSVINPEDVLMRPQQTVERELLREVYQGQRILVTGAGGSIGSELVRQLASLDPAELVLVDSCEFNAYQIDRSLGRFFPNVRRQMYIGCIRDREHIDNIFNRHLPDIVFNAAALKHVPLVEANPCEGVLTNVIGTRNVCDAARKVGARAMVQVSTDKAVNTTNVMGATKRVGEFYCQAQDLISREVGGDTRFFAVRFGNVLGSSGSLIPLFQEQIARGGPLTVTDARMERYFMTIREAVQLTLVSAAHGLNAQGDNGRIFVLDMGEPVRIMDMAERMIRMSGKVPGEDIKIEIIGARPGEKLFEELFDRNEVMQPAGFPGVNCAIPDPVPMPRLRAAMLGLEKAARRGDAAEVRSGLAALVPGYGEAAGIAAPTPVRKARKALAAAPVKPTPKQPANQRQTPIAARETVYEGALT